MPSYSKNDVVLTRYPFANLSSTKVRPAIVISSPHESQDVFVVPLTSRSAGLLSGEFILSDWQAAGLQVPTAVKRGVYTVHSSLIIKVVGKLTPTDAVQVDQSVRSWLGLTTQGTQM